MSPLDRSGIWWSVCMVITDQESKMSCSESVKMLAPHSKGFILNRICVLDVETVGKLMKEEGQT